MHHESHAESHTPDPPANTPAPSVGDDVMKIIGSVEAQFDKLRSLGQAHDDQLATLAERSQQLKDHEDALELRRLELEERAQAIESRREDLEAEQDRTLNELAGQESELNARQAACREQEADIETRHAACQEREASLSRDQEQLQHDRTQFASEREQVESEREALQAERSRLESLQVEFEQANAAFAQERAALQERVDQAESNVGALMKDLEQSSAQVESMTTSLEESAAALDDRNQRIEALEASIRDADARVEQAEQDGLDMAQELEQQRDAIRSELEHAINVRDTLNTRVTALGADVESLNAALAEKDAVIREHEQKLELAGEKLQRFVTALEEQSPQLERGAAALMKVQEQQTQIERLTTELQEARSSSDGESSAAIADRDAQINDLTNHLSQLKDNADRAVSEANQARQEAEQKLASADGGGAERESELTATIESLRNDLTSTEEALAEALTKASTTSTDEAAALQAKADRISMVAQHLRRRRKRLQFVRQQATSRARSGASQRSSVDTEQRAAQIRHLEQQRIQLGELKTVLASSEKQMVQRWARPRAVSTIGWLVILAALSCGISWFAADHFRPARIAVSAEIEPKTQMPDTVTEDEALAWQDWHANLVHEPSFQKTLAQRAKDHHLSAYASPSVIKSRLQADLLVDKSAPGRLTFSLAGYDADESLAFMDLMISTMSVESRRQSSKRTDGAWVVVPGERRGDQGEVRFASLNPVAIEDERLMFAGMIAGGVFMALLMLIALVYARLVRAKRVFDQGVPADAEDVDLSSIGPAV